ncbi:hypothetical protein BGY98DRAFT_1096685 [Russula aff. rugulosa BPL654]|nr:hypothetical protein BGY98DRAFT_1096685 [Russula aff. rugulosa BPL654]
MNPSDVPHILTAREEKQVKRSIAKEATVADKHVAQVGKALKSAENDEEKAEKAMQKAKQARDKTVKQERSTAQALTNAQHKHDLAVADEHKAANDLSVRIATVVTLAQAMCEKYLQEAHRAIESRRTELEQAQSKKDSGDVARVERLRQAQRGTASGAAQAEPESNDM